MHCSQRLDRRWLDFSGSFTTAGWLRRQDFAARLGRYIRSRCEGEPRCSVDAKSPTFHAHLQVTRTNVRSGTPAGIYC